MISETVDNETRIIINIRNRKGFLSFSEVIHHEEAYLNFFYVF